MLQSLSASSCVSPVPVEATLALVTDVLGEDGLQGAQAAWRVHVTDDANYDHGGGLQDGHSLDHLLLVHLCRQTHVVSLGFHIRKRQCVKSRCGLCSVRDNQQGLGPIMSARR